MTILDGLLRGESAGARTQTWTREGVVLDVGGLQKTLRVSRGDEAFDAGRYASWLVKTSDNAESAVRPVVLRARRPPGFE